uniref:Uncharacterized protein n=1 Tax=Oryza brachyantha TaxID=4533 RepID=J3LQ36_ORYBR
MQATDVYTSVVHPCARKFPNFPAIWFTVLHFIRTLHSLVEWISCSQAACQVTPQPLVKYDVNTFSILINLINIYTTLKSITISTLEISLCSYPRFKLWCTGVSLMTYHSSFQSQRS